MPEKQNAFEKELSPWDYHEAMHQLLRSERQKKAQQDLMQNVERIVKTTMKEMEKQDGHKSTA